MRKASEPERNFHLEPRVISAKNVGEDSSKTVMEGNPKPGENPPPIREQFLQKPERGTQAKPTENTRESAAEMQSHLLSEI